jgi:signal transduction histidine kinase/DNA-binding response OmpR family regulator
MPLATTAICPITGASIHSRAQWCDVPMEGGARLTFQILDGAILQIITSGLRTAASEEQYEKLHDAIVAECFPNDQPFAEIHDITGMGGLPSPELRRLYSLFHLSPSFRNCRGCFIYGDNLILKTVFRVGLALRGDELHYPMKVVENHRTAVETSRQLLKTDRLSLADFHFAPEWKLTAADGQSGVDLGIARRNILYLRYWGTPSPDLASQLLAMNQTMLDAGHLVGPTYSRIGDYSRMRSANLQTRLHYAHGLRQFNERNHLQAKFTLIVGAPSWVRISMAFTTRIVPLPLVHVASAEEAFARIEGQSLSDALLNSILPHPPSLTFEELEFRPEWTLETQDGKGSIAVGIAHFKVLCIRIRGQIHDVQLVEQLVPLCLQLVQQGWLIGPEYVRVTDFEEMGEVSLAARRTYAQGIGQFHELAGIQPSQTVLLGASILVRASQIFFSHLTRQPVRYVRTWKQALELAGAELHGTQTRKGLLDKDVHAVKAADLAKLVRLLGSLAWEIEGDDVRFPENHPLHEAAEAFRLVKEDYKAVLERHREAERKAIEASAAKSDFLANMSHEIRTPLNGVVGMIQLLADSSLSSEQRQHAEIARSSADSLLELVNDILDLSKIEAGKLDLEEVSFDLSSMLDDFTSVMGPRAQEKALELVCNPHRDTPRFIAGDPVRLRQILTNLVSNALKFTPSGEIVLSVQPEAESSEDVLLRFSVRDSGIGISSEKLHCIFENFSQADSSTTRKFGGTGLGLSISRQLAHKMGGEIGVKSSLGSGSTFWFTARMRKSAQAVPEIESPESLRGIQVLVVDDNTAARLVLEHQLTGLGMRVDTAGDATSALEILQSAPSDNPFRIAIIDQRMPEIDGEELIRTIRKSSEWNELRIIMASAFGMKLSPQKLHQSGISAFLQKPVRRTELVRSLLHCLDEGHESTFASQDSTFPAPATSPFRPSNLIRLLVVEDNVTNQKVAQGMLKKLGYQTEIAAHGQEALDFLRLQEFDLVLMDCQMPVMDGYEATRRIRSGTSDVRNPRIPIVAMTANALVGDRELVLEAGMDDFLTKPISQARLQQTLERWLFSHPGD